MELRLQKLIAMILRINCLLAQSADTLLTMTGIIAHLLLQNVREFHWN